MILSVIAAVAVVRHGFHVQPPRSSTDPFGNIVVLLSRSQSRHRTGRLQNHIICCSFSHLTSWKRSENSGTAVCTEQVSGYTTQVPLKCNFDLFGSRCPCTGCILCHARYQLFLGSSIFFILLLLHLHVVCMWLWVMPPAVFLKEILHASSAG